MPPRKWTGKIVPRRVRKSGGVEDEELEIDNDPHVWSLDTISHYHGKLSMAAVKANAAVEDNSQVEVGVNCLFLGVYDGHGGAEASKYLNTHLFRNLIANIPHLDYMSEEVLKDAVSATENSFARYVESGYHQKPELARGGSSCLAAFLWKGSYLFLANLGDSRAVLGYVKGGSKRIWAEQLTTDHNAGNEDIRQELKEAHPDDPMIVTKNNGTWRVKGIIEVTRAIGDFYLKRLPFTLDPSFPRFEEVPPPFTQSVISSEPETRTRVITESDRFIICASKGLWQLLTNERAVEIVHNCPKKGIAKRLVEAALKVAAKNRGISYRHLHQMPLGDGFQNNSRGFYHEDVSVIVLFVNDFISTNIDTIPLVSHTGFSHSTRLSRFSQLTSYIDLISLHRQIKLQRRLVEDIIEREKFKASSSSGTPPASAELEEAMKTLEEMESVLSSSSSPPARYYSPGLLFETTSRRSDEPGLADNTSSIRRT